MREVHAEIEIASHSRQVIDAFTSVDQMQRWWGVHHGLVDAQHDGTWTLAWDVPDNRFGYVVLTGYVRVLGHSQLLIGNLVYLNRSRHPLGPMTLSVTVEEAAGACQVIVSQGGYRHGEDWDWYYQLVRENWPLALEQLKQHLERFR